jgi:hypothetical protein
MKRLADAVDVGPRQAALGAMEERWYAVGNGRVRLCRNYSETYAEWWVFDVTITPPKLVDKGSWVIITSVLKRAIVSGA